MIQLHNDVLMLTLQIANHNVHRVLVENSSFVDVLFYSIYNQIRLPPKALKPISTPLYGFLSCSVQPIRGVELLVTAGNRPTKTMVLTNFLVVDILSDYNITIGQLTLNALRVIA